MSALAGVNPSITTLAGLVSDALRSGTNVRSTIGSKDAAFAWSVGLPRTLATFVTTALAEGDGYTALRIEPSGTPAGVYTDGTPKNIALTVTPVDVPLQCFAGAVEYSSRKQVTSDSIAQALTAGLVNQCMAAFEHAAIATALADAGGPSTGTSWTAAVLDAVGAIAAAGGTAGVWVVAPADLAAAVEAQSSLVFAGTEAIPQVLGLQVHTSPALTPGTGLVLDPRGILVTELTESPTVLASIDARANKVTLAVDLWASTVVTSPAVVRKVTTAAGTAAKA